MQISDVLSDKKVLFITTKNTDYLRNTQEVELISKCADSVKVLGYGDKSYIKRLIKIYFKLFTMSLKAYDTVFVGFSPQLIIPVFGFRFRKKTVISDFFISVYDTMVNDRKKFKPKSLMGRFSKSVDKKCIRCSDYTVVDTIADRDYFAEEFGLVPEKTEVLYLQADNAIYYPREAKKPDKLKDKFTVLYFGSILPLQGVEVITDAMDILKDRKDMQFIIIGPIGKNIRHLESDNIKYINWLPQEKLAKYISYADLCLAGHFNGDIDKAKRTIAGKTYIYENMGKPMILGENNANHELFKEDDRHFFVEMGDGRKLADKITEIKEKFERKTK